MLLGGDDAADDDVQRAQLRLQLLIRRHALRRPLSRSSLQIDSEDCPLQIDSKTFD